MAMDKILIVSSVFCILFRDFLPKISIKDPIKKGCFACNNCRGSFLYSDMRTLGTGNLDVYLQNYDYSTVSNIVNFS